MWYLLVEIEKTYLQLIISVFTRSITPLSLAPTGHPRSHKTGYLLIAQYLCYINFWAPVSELYPLLELAENRPRR